MIISTIIISQPMRVKGGEPVGVTGAGPMRVKGGEPAGVTGAEYASV